CVGVAVTSSGCVRRGVIRSVSAERIRCTSCGYLLRGLCSATCPECGRDATGPIEYRLGRWTKPQPSRIRHVALGLLVLMLLLTPVELPVVLWRLPGSWLKRLPQALQSPWLGQPFSANVFPIALRSVCVVRHQNS